MTTVFLSQNTKAPFTGATACVKSRVATIAEVPFLLREDTDTDGRQQNHAALEAPRHSLQSTGTPTADVSCSKLGAGILLVNNENGAAVF